MLGGPELRFNETEWKAKKMVVFLSF